jgi:hypothetical protein
MEPIAPRNTAELNSEQTGLADGYTFHPVFIAGRKFRLLAGDDPEPAQDTDSGRTVRYRIVVQRGLEGEVPAFARTVVAALSDPAGWSAAGLSFKRVDTGADLTIMLARPKTVDKLCRPLDTGGVYSCALYGRAVINLSRWRRGVRHFAGDLETYRSYVINHEVGHLLGEPHRRCTQAGEPAPVMMQQTKHLRGCAPNAQPLAQEIEHLRGRE